MNKKPTKKQTNADDNAPATKGDIREAIDELAQATQKGFAEVHSKLSTVQGDIVEMKGDIVEMKGDIVEMKGDIKDTRGTMASILNIVESIDEHFKAHQDLPARVAEHNQEIFRLKHNPK